MGQSMGMLDFFVLEAGEYLERLDAMAQTPAGTLSDAEEFIRIARAFRGSALMASRQALARAAQGLEAVGRTVREGRVAWDERVRAEVIRAVDDCKTLLRRVRAPADDDAAKAIALGETLDRLAGRPSAGGRAPGTGLDAGSRAFIAREATAIASSLDRAAQALAADPAGREALRSVAPAMSALRGVAVLSDLAPLPDILVGVEGALKEVLATSGAVRLMVPAVFDAGAKALARAAREVVDIGRPAPESEQAVAFASLLLRAFASPGNILPVELLFYDDAGPHVVREGTAPPDLSKVEIVSQGEFLATAAEDLRRVTSPVLRDLRLFGMGASLRPLAGAGGSPLSGGLGRLADAGRSAIDRGAAAANVDTFTAIVADAAQTLRAGQAGDQATLAARLDAASARLNALVAAPAAAPGALPPVTPTAPGAPAARPAPPRSTRAIPELVAARPRPHPPAPTLAAPAGEADLADAYATVERMIAARGLPPGSLEELLAAPAAIALAEPEAAPEEAGVVPIESLAPDTAEEDVVGIEALAPDESPIVPIENLLYRGPDALRRVLDLKSEFAALAAAGGPSPRLMDLQREVFDLVELGLRLRQ
jgi:hypothetical protein